MLHVNVHVVPCASCFRICSSLERTRFSTGDVQCSLFWPMDVAASCCSSSEVGCWISVQILSFSSLVGQGNTTLRPEHWFSSSLIQGHPGHTGTVPNDGFLQVHLTVFIVKIANSYLIATYILKCFGYLFHSPYKSVITEIVRRRGEKSFAFFKIWSVIDLNLVHSHIADPGLENRSEARKYHVISLGAPNGHLSKPRIQMQSMVFSGVLTV